MQPRFPSPIDHRTRFVRSLPHRPARCRLLNCWIACVLIHTPSISLHSNTMYPRKLFVFRKRAGGRGTLGPVLHFQRNAVQSSEQDREEGESVLRVELEVRCFKVACSSVCDVQVAPCMRNITLRVQKGRLQLYGGMGAHACVGRVVRREELQLFACR